MNPNEIIQVPGLTLDNPSLRSLDRLLGKMVTVMTVYSSEAPSRRIEGQFGSEVMEEQFSDMAVYLQYSSILDNPEVVENIIRSIYKACCKINRHYQMLNRIFLFNTPDGQIKLACRNRLSGQALDPEALSQAISDFVPSEDVRTINQLYRVEQNSLLVFITDSSGCQLSEDILKRKRRVARQSIWIKIGEEGMEIRRGFPERTKGE